MPRCSSVRRRVRHVWLVGSALCAALLVAPTPAVAHQSSVTHSEVMLTPARTRRDVAYRLLVAPADLAEAAGLPAGAVPDDAQIAAHGDAIARYIQARIAVSSGEQPCPADPARVALVDDGGRWVELRWTAHCPGAIATLVIDYTLFFDLDPLHSAMLRVDAGRGDPASTVLQEGASRFVWELAEGAPAGLLGFVRSGVDHILFGFDHIAFLLGLLLVVCIAPAPPGGRAGGGGAGWQQRDIGQALRATAAIVTAFTVAHSLTLIAAALGWVSLPSRLVESTIAGSIAFVALQNLVRPQAGYRYLVTFGFGLVHGLGFARMLAVMLPPDDVVAPLLAFNVGVELGQLGIVAAVLPLLHLVTRAVGASRYRERVLPAASGLLAVLGLVWLVERAFDVVLLGIG